MATGGLYGNTTTAVSTFFTYFIYQSSVTQPATPTTGSWNFATNVGTPPSGWSNSPPVAPASTVWVSTAFVNSQNPSILTWTTPAFFTNPAAIAAITSGTINNTSIGATTPSTGAFTTLSGTQLNVNYGTTAVPSLVDPVNFNLGPSNGYLGINSNVGGGVNLYNNGVVAGGIYAGAGALSVTLNASNDSTIRLSRSTSATPNAIRFYNNGTETVQFNGTGKVLIGGTLTDDGVNLVQVSGSLKATGINSTPVGSTTPSTGAFTTLSASNVAASSYTTTSFSNTASTGYSQIQLSANNASVNSTGYLAHAPGVFTRLGNTSGDVIQVAPNGSVIGSFSSTGLAVIGALSATGSLTVGSGIAGANSLLTINGGTSASFGTGVALQKGGGTNIGYFADTGLLQGDTSSNVGLQANVGKSINFYVNGGITPSATIDTSGNLGLGVVPSAWSTNYKAIDLGSAAFRGSLASYIGNAQTFVSSNAYNNGTNWIYSSTSGASQYQLSGVGSSHAWYTAPSGTAGNPITFTQAMTLDASGRLLVPNGTVVAPVAFASLPASPVAGQRAMINNSVAAPAFLSTAAGGGAVTVPVFYNGTTWLVG